MAAQKYDGFVMFPQWTCQCHHMLWRHPNWSVILTHFPGRRVARMEGTNGLEWESEKPCIWCSICCVTLESVISPLSVGLHKCKDLSSWAGCGSSPKFSEQVDYKSVSHYLLVHFWQQNSRSRITSSALQAFRPSPWPDGMCTGISNSF